MPQYQTILAIDQGTTSTRSVIYDKQLNVISTYQLEQNQYFPHPGWVEQDPTEIFKNTQKCMNGLQVSGGDNLDIVAVGITNQRETTVVWDRRTGQPLYRAIVWNDTRTQSIVSELESNLSVKEKQNIQHKCGLPLTTYFSALKLLWLLSNVKAVQEAVDRGTCMFGTVDSWLIWNLTGGINGGQHITDVTNASRTMLMDLETCQWSDELKRAFGIPLEGIHFPKIVSSGEYYGTINDNTVFNSIPITGCLGDQQSAMVGQRCFDQGSAKNTYGTGCFLLLNTGTAAIRSSHGLLSTVCFQFGNDSPCYALEGSIAVAGSAISWLRDNLGIIESPAQTEEMATRVEDTGGVFFIPAFSGLFAPHWRTDAKGSMIGITQYTNKNHIVRATLESICHQTQEVFNAMEKDAEFSLKLLKVDGGMSSNGFAMQTQADLLGVDVVRPSDRETTVKGAAIAAGIGAGLWSIDTLPVPDTAPETTFHPSISYDERKSRIQQWNQVINHLYL
eukprot:gb/GECH01009641.1/.p1 GENE.gb/GECH01009641.1/~~gb/GECH01009641.1/.p1  ORF type:complete len:504 (+),score=115.02 gb/GECH01009641.1/:1-1512(+)